jgi:four helix bundle protein
MEFRSYRNLKAWQAGMDVAEAAYKITSSLPKHEIYGLTSQIQRSATSVPANIAEGHARESTKDFLRFLSIAQGSLAELETHLLLAQRFAYINENDLEKIMQLTDETGKIVRGLQRSLKQRLEARD